MDGDASFSAASAVSVAVRIPPSPSPSPRRLSGNFRRPSRPVPAARQLAWLSLQGRLVGAPEATSSQAIGGHLSLEGASAWELFSPIERVLIVAVVAAATAAGRSRKAQQISQLRRSVELRDEVLSIMQQKLDNLCQQMSCMKDQVETGVFFEDKGTKINSISAETCSYKCQICKLNQGSAILNNRGNTLSDSKRDLSQKVFTQEELFKIPFTDNAEQEERRMSDLSDWCSSVTSSAEIPLNSLAVEQDIYNLQKECDEKDATIKEIVNLARVSEDASSKRISELEDIIRRKNMIITKLKKDMVVLEQKVMHLTRLRRPSFVASNPDSRNLPVMATNVLYDMDNSTSPSSSDSECPSVIGQCQTECLLDDEDATHKYEFSTSKSEVPSPTKPSKSLSKAIDGKLKHPVSPLKEIFLNQSPGLCMPLRSHLTSSVGELRRSRRRIQSGLKAAPLKRWS